MLMYAVDVDSSALHVLSDTVIDSIVVKPEGYPQEVTRSRFICLDKGKPPGGIRPRL